MIRELPKMPWYHYTCRNYYSLFVFVDKLLSIGGQQLSAQVLKMLGHHGEQILNSIYAHQPNMINKWTINTSGGIFMKETKRLADYLCLSQGSQVSEVLSMLSSWRIMSEAEKIVPTLCQILHLVTISEKPNRDEVWKDCGLVCRMSNWPINYNQFTTTDSHHSDLHACTNL